jgi:hypothetical protein
MAGYNGDRQWSGLQGQHGPQNSLVLKSEFQKSQERYRTIGPALNFRFESVSSDALLSENEYSEWMMDQYRKEQQKDFGSGHM